MGAEKKGKETIMVIFRVLFLVLLLPFVVEARGGLPLVKKGMPPDTIVGAMGDPASDRSCVELISDSRHPLNVPRKAFAKALCKLHGICVPLEQLQAYYANFDVRPISPGTRILMTEVKFDGKTCGIGEFERLAYKGEMGFYDRNSGRLVASATCGNVGKEIRPRVAERRQQRPLRREVQYVTQAAPQPLPQLQPMFGGMQALGYSADHSMGVAHMGVRAARERRPDEFYFNQSIRVPVNVQQSVDVRQSQSQRQEQRQRNRVIVHHPPPPRPQPTPPPNDGGPVGGDPPPFPDDGGPVGANPPPFPPDDGGPVGGGPSTGGNPAGANPPPW